MAATQSVDVLVVGGGPVGGCAAALLSSPAAGAITAPRVVLLEPQRPSWPERDAEPDLRVSAFSRASERILRTAGAWQAIAAHRVSPYERMHVWHADEAPRSAGALTFDAAEVGEPNLGYIIENRVVQAALLAAFEERGGYVAAGALVSIEIGRERARVVTSCGVFDARLVVGADGAKSSVREAAGIHAQTVDYRQRALVAVVATERPHERTAWQRFLPSGTLAFLPLADGTSSIVWSTDDDEVSKLLAADEQSFSRALDAASDGVLGRTQVRSQRQAFPLQRLSAESYVTERVALIGDAAHVVHPLAGQGVNLGLLDAAALSESILAAASEREDPGALRVLRRYERWRRSENELMSAAIDAFNRFLAHGAGPLARLAQRGLGLVNRSQELKAVFIRRALGLTGELPAAARRAEG
ncbi:MAG: UbiH/UbiF/VisC/COQ6 family ubiquinone biosynthesis hydroxylase [Gammaproteobacteria bacterium]